MPAPPRQRIRTAKGRKVSSTAWIERQLSDPYVRKAKAEGYRSRAAYKLIELDERFHFLKGARRVLDLGVTPGGWTQVVRKTVPQAIVVGDWLADPTPEDAGYFGLNCFDADFNIVGFTSAFGSAISAQPATYQITGDESDPIGADVAVATDEGLARIVGWGVAYVRTLPPK